MWIRATVVWLAILMVAIANGALRQGVLVPRVGAGAGHVLSTLLLSAAVLAVTVMAIGWLAPGTPADAWRVGAYWVGLTLAFEFLAGHYVFGTPWATLAADYRIHEGRVWILVLVTVLVAPVLAGRWRRRW